MSDPRSYLSPATREALDDAARMLDELDSVSPSDMTPMYYANGFENLQVALREPCSDSATRPLAAANVPTPRSNQ